MVKMVGGKEVTITHIMADGRELDSLKGYLTSVDQLPPLTRTLLINLLTGAQDEGGQTE